MRELSMEISNIAPLWGFVPKVNQGRDPAGNLRLGWGHSCFLRFRFEDGLEDVMTAFVHDVDKADGRGRRTQKIQWSTVEILMPEDGGGTLVEQFSDRFGLRFDPGHQRLREGVTICGTDLLMDLDMSFTYLHGLVTGWT